MQDHTIDASAEAIIRLPITNRTGKFVTLCAEGYAIFCKFGFKSIFMSTDGSGNYSYPSVADMTSPGEMATLARALTGAGKGQRARCRDRDVTNLRLSNLYLEKGAAKGPTPRHPNLAGGAA